MNLLPYGRLGQLEHGLQELLHHLRRRRPCSRHLLFLCHPPLAFPLKVQPKIVKCDPGREVIWEGGKLGINASHTWQFREEDGKVKLLSVESFKGPMVWVGYLLSVPQRLHKLTVEFLQTLKEASEACTG